LKKKKQRAKWGDPHEKHDCLSKKKKTKKCAGKIRNDVDHKNHQGTIHRVVPGLGGGQGEIQKHKKKNEQASGRRAENRGYDNEKRVLYVKINRRGKEKRKWAGKAVNLGGSRCKEKPLEDVVA